MIRFRAPSCTEIHVAVDSSGWGGATSEGSGDYGHHSACVSGRNSLTPTKRESNISSHFQSSPFAMVDDDGGNGSAGRQQHQHNAPPLLQRFAPRLL